MLVGQPLNRRRSHLSATMQTDSHPSIQLLQLVHVHVLQPFSPQVMQQPAVKLVHFNQPLRYTATRCAGDVCRKASQQPAKDTAECCDAEPNTPYSILRALRCWEQGGACQTEGRQRHSQHRDQGAQLATAHQLVASLAAL